MCHLWKKAGGIKPVTKPVKWPNANDRVMSHRHRFDIIVPTAATIPRQTLSELCLVVRFDRNLPSFASAHQSLASSQQRKPIWRCTTVPVYHLVRLCHQTAHVSKPTQYANKKSLTLWQVVSDNLCWETSKIQHWRWIAEDISKSAESNPGPNKWGFPFGKILYFFLVLPLVRFPNPPVSRGTWMF